MSMNYPISKWFLEFIFVVLSSFGITTTAHAILFQLVNSAVGDKNGNTSSLFAEYSNAPDTESMRPGATDFSLMITGAPFTDSDRELSDAAVLGTAVDATSADITLVSWSFSETGQSDVHLRDNSQSGRAPTSHWQTTDDAVCFFPVDYAVSLSRANLWSDPTPGSGVETVGVPVPEPPAVKYLLLAVIAVGGITWLQIKHRKRNPPPTNRV